MKKLLPPLLFCLFLLACAGEKKREGVANGKTAVGNFDYVFFVKNNGATPQPGDSVFFHFNLKKGGEVVASSKQLGRAHVLEFPLEYTGVPQPMLEGLRLMSPGDSMSIQMKISADADEIVTYELKLDSILARKNQ